MAVFETLNSELPPRNAEKEARSFTTLGCPSFLRVSV
jgi:hypothetical protein